MKISCKFSTLAAHSGSWASVSKFRTLWDDEASAHCSHSYMLFKHLRARSVDLVWVPGMISDGFALLIYIVSISWNGSWTKTMATERSLSEIVRLSAEPPRRRGPRPYIPGTFYQRSIYLSIFSSVGTERAHHEMSHFLTILYDCTISIEQSYMCRRSKVKGPRNIYDNTDELPPSGLRMKGIDI